MPRQVDDKSGLVFGFARGVSGWGADVNANFQRIAYNGIGFICDQMGVSTPPASPGEGATYIVGASPTGAWATFSQNNVAVFGHSATGGSLAWFEIEPPEGKIGYDKNTNTIIAYNGSAWDSIAALSPTQATQLQNLATFALIATGLNALTDDDRLSFNSLKDVPAMALTADQATKISNAITSIMVGTGLTGDGVTSDLAVETPYTAAEKTKLAGIPSDASDDQTATEIRDALVTLTGSARLPATAVRDLPSGGGSSTQSDWNEDDTSDSAFIKNKPTIPSDLTTKLTKLDGIESNAERNVKSDWNATGGDSQILNKPTIPGNTEIDTRVAENVSIWALKTNLMSLPVAKLGTGTPDGTKFLRDDGSWQTVSGTGLDQSAVDARISSQVRDFAQVGDATLVPLLKLPSIPTTKITGTFLPGSLGTGARTGNKFLRDDGTWQLPPAGSGGGGGGGQTTGGGGSASITDFTGATQATTHSIPTGTTKTYIVLGMMTPTADMIKFWRLSEFELWCEVILTMKLTTAGTTPVTINCRAVPSAAVTPVYGEGSAQAILSADDTMFRFHFRLDFGSALPMAFRIQLEAVHTGSAAISITRTASRAISYPKQVQIDYSHLGIRRVIAFNSPAYDSAMSITPTGNPTAIGALAYNKTLGYILARQNETDSNKYRAYNPATGVELSAKTFSQSSVIYADDIDFDTDGRHIYLSSGTSFRVYDLGAAGESTPTRVTSKEFTITGATVLVGIAVTASNVWILDRRSSDFRVYKYSKTGTLEATYTGTGRINANCLAVKSDLSRFYIGANDHCIGVYQIAANGLSLVLAESWPVSQGALNIYGITQASDDNYYVASLNSVEIQKYDKSVSGTQSWHRFEIADRTFPNSAFAGYSIYCFSILRSSTHVFLMGNRGSSPAISYNFLFARLSPTTLNVLDSQNPSRNTVPNSPMGIWIPSFFIDANDNIYAIASDATYRYVQYNYTARTWGTVSQLALPTSGSQRAPRNVTQDNVYFWVLTFGAHQSSQSTYDGNAYCYRLSDKSRVPSRDINYTWTDLGANGNAYAYKIFVDDTYFYFVANTQNTDKFLAYNKTTGVRVRDADFQINGFTSANSNGTITLVGDMLLGSAGSNGPHFRAAKLTT